MLVKNKIKNLIVIFAIAIFCSSLFVGTASANLAGDLAADPSTAPNQTPSAPSNSTTPSNGGATNGNDVPVYTGINTNVPSNNLPSADVGNNTNSNVPLYVPSGGNPAPSGGGNPAPNTNSNAAPNYTGLNDLLNGGNPAPNGGGGNPAPAATGVYMPTKAETGLPDSTVKQVLSTFLKWLLEIVGVIALIGFVISGIQYVLAAGNDKDVEAAKKMMTNSILGIIVALAGFVVIQAIDTILNANSGA